MGMMREHSQDHSQTIHKAKTCECDLSQGSFTDLYSVNDQVQNTHSQAIHKHSHGESALSSLARESLPRRGRFSAGEGTREWDPDRADWITAEFKNLALPAGLGGNPDSFGWLFRAFEQDFATGAVLAQAIRNVDGTEEI